MRFPSPPRWPRGPGPAPVGPSRARPVGSVRESGRAQRLGRARPRRAGPAGAGGRAPPTQEKERQEEEARKNAEKTRAKELREAKSIANKAVAKVSVVLAKLGAAFAHPKVSNISGFATKSGRESQKKLNAMFDKANEVVQGTIQTTGFSLTDLRDACAAGESNANLMNSMAAAAAKHAGAS